MSSSGPFSVPLTFILLTVLIRLIIDQEQFTDNYLEEGKFLYLHWYQQDMISRKKKENRSEIRTTQMPV